MSPLFYVLIGVIGGGFVVAVIALVARRGPSGDMEAQLVNRLEVIDRGLRDEFSRNREEAGAAAKNQREELGKSLENVRGIVDLRLQELQKTTRNKSSGCAPPLTRNYTEPWKSGLANRLNS